MKTLRAFALSVFVLLLFEIRAAVPETAASTNQTRSKSTYIVRERTAADIVKLHDAGVGKSVILAYVRNSRAPYSATADDILFLNEHRIPDEIICEWINKGSSLIAAAAQSPARSPDLVAAYRPASPLPVPQVPAQPVTYQVEPVIISAPATYVPSAYVYAHPPSWWIALPVYAGFGYRWNRPYGPGWSYYAPRYHHSPWRASWGGRYGYGSFGAHRHWVHASAGFRSHHGGFGRHSGHFSHGGHRGHFRGSHR